VLLTSSRYTEVIRLRKLDSKYLYPVHKHHTRGQVERLRTAESSLDTVWQAADATFRQRAGTSPHEIVVDIIQERALQRTPPWVEPGFSSKNGTQSPVVESINIPFSSALHNPTKQITGGLAKLTASTNQKLKTHELARPEGDIPVAAPPLMEEPDDEQPIFYVDKRAHRVFRNLFHSPISRDQPGKIPWTDFLHAMISTGFAAQKLQGSAWQFTPRNMNVEQPIQFHEPHPEAMLPFT
jgi:hypothetical protein